MSYALESDLSPNRISSVDLARLTCDTNPASQVVSAVVDEKLAEASGIVEMYSRERYALPLQPTRELVGITCSIALYLLYQRKPAGPMPESIGKGYDDVMRLLRDVAAKKAGLDQPIGTQDQGSAGGPIVSSRSRNGIVTNSLKGYF